MKSTGVTRPIDQLGRIVIPAELRHSLNLDEGDRMEIFTEGDRIVLRKYQSGCIFCGEVNNVQIFKDKSICAECAISLPRPDQAGAGQ